MPYRNEVRPVNVFADFMAGKNAAQEERAANRRNALADMQLQRAESVNALAQNPNATPEDYIRAGDVQTGTALQNSRTASREGQQQALLQFVQLARRGLEIPDPQARRQFLKQASAAFGPHLSALGGDPSKAMAELDTLSDEELTQRMTQVAQFAPAQTKEGFTLSEGQQRFDANGKVVASVAPKLEKGTSQWRYLTPDEIKQRWLPEGTSAQIDTVSNKVEIVSRPGADSKPIPVGALRMAQDARDALSVATGMDTELSRIDTQIRDGKLNLGVVANLASRGKNATGLSDENSRNFQLMRSTFEKMRNDSLRLNKGVQTEGDAQRAWDELFANLSDEKAVRAQIARIRSINERAIQLQEENRDAVYENYGRETPRPSGAASPARPAGAQKRVRVDAQGNVIGN
jgi:hypothetical protein